MFFAPPFKIERGDHSFALTDSGNDQFFVSVVDFTFCPDFIKNFLLIMDTV